MDKIPGKIGVRLANLRTSVLILFFAGGWFLQG
jgi:hypothetical protein